MVAVTVALVSSLKSAHSWSLKRPSVGWWPRQATINQQHDNGEEGGGDEQTRTAVAEQNRRVV
jgi:hypothetical protein